MLQLKQSENTLKNKDEAYRVAYIPYPKGVGDVRSVYKCSCGKNAVVFIGLNDPDETDYPKCRKCADEWSIEFIMKLSKAKK